MAGKLLACGVLLTGSIAMGSGLPFERTTPPRFSVARARVATTIAVDTSAPTLRAAPSRVVLDGAQAETPVTLTGEHFEADDTIRLNSPLHVVVFGPSSFDRLGPTVLRFNAATLQDGEYSMCVRSPAGRFSNEVTITVKHQK
jgi:hypothetical protein